MRVRPGREPRAIARTAGARFGFRLREHLGGTTVETSVTPDLNGVVDFDIVRLAGIADNVVVERCARCSPRLIHVRSLDGFKPVLAVTRTWLSTYDVVFDNPSDGQRRRVGDFTIEVTWPQLRVTCARDMPVALLSQLCEPFAYELKPDAEALQRYGGRFGGRRNLVARGGNAEKTWCDCPGGPQKGGRPAPDVARERTVAANDTAAAGYRIDDVKRVKLTFRKPMVEREELTGPELRAGR